MDEVKIKPVNEFISEKGYELDQTIDINEALKLSTDYFKENNIEVDSKLVWNAVLREYEQYYKPYNLDITVESISIIINIFLLKIINY